MQEVQHITLCATDSTMRLDRWLAARYPSLSWGAVQKLLRSGQVRLNGKRVKAATRLAAGQVVRIPPLQETSPSLPPERTSHAWKTRLRALVLYADDDMIVLNKPAGLAVQGGSKTRLHLDGMLDALQEEGGERPRLVHRLDRDTGGALLLAKTRQAARFLGDALKRHQTRKLYWALCHGVPTPKQGCIDAPLRKTLGAGATERMVVSCPDHRDAKPAITRYTTIETIGDAGDDAGAWLALEPVTGRTHQLRAHMASIHCPLYGDGKYGSLAHKALGEYLREKAAAPMLHLHARAICFPLKQGGKKIIEAPLPKHMENSWQRLGLDLNTAPSPDTWWTQTT